MADQAKSEDMEVVTDKPKPIEIGGFSSMEEFTNVRFAWFAKIDNDL